MFLLIANANFFRGCERWRLLRMHVCVCASIHLCYKHCKCPCLLLLMKPYTIRETSANDIVVLVRFMSAVL